MKRATVRQLRHDFGTVLNWVEEGETVEISKRGKVVALMTPPPPPSSPRPKKRPDFAARLKRRDGDRVIPASVMNDILDYNKGAH
jgi:antitoxin (DNA-binding transcriptional repressor) of toxin-antitoxin stability system